MATKVVGKLDSWAEGDVGTSDFMNLEEGSNLVRCVTSPYQFYIHWVNDVSGQARKVRCALKDCPACQQGVKSQPRWYVGVLNRKSNKPAILEMGPQIFKQIVSYSKKEKWGDPRQYDVDVEKQPKGTQPLYIVSPEPKEELTSGEKTLLKAFIEKTDMVKMVEAPTPEKIREVLGMAPVPAEKTSEKTTSTSDDEDFNFDSN